MLPQKLRPYLLACLSLIPITQYVIVSSEGGGGGTQHDRRCLRLGEVRQRYAWYDFRVAASEASQKGYERLIYSVVGWQYSHPIGNIFKELSDDLTIQWMTYVSWANAHEVPKKLADILSALRTSVCKPMRCRGGLQQLSTSSTSMTSSMTVSVSGALEVPRYCNAPVDCRESISPGTHNRQSYSVFAIWCATFVDRDMVILERSSSSEGMIEQMAECMSVHVMMMTVRWNWMQTLDLVPNSLALAYSYLVSSTLT